MILPYNRISKLSDTDAEKEQHEKDSFLYGAKRRQPCRLLLSGAKGRFSYTHLKRVFGVFKVPESFPGNLSKPQSPLLMKQQEPARDEPATGRLAGKNRFETDCRKSAFPIGKDCR